MVESRRAFVSLVVVSCLGMLVASSSANSLSRQGAESSNLKKRVAASALAVIEGGGGSWNAESGRLTLTDVAPQSAWFTDRPVNQAGSDDISLLLAWFFGETSSPNAALEFEGPSGHGVTLVEVSKPSYDDATQTLEFDTSIITDAAHRLRDDSALVDFVKIEDATIPPSFSAARLTVESAKYRIETQDESVSPIASSGNCEPSDDGMYTRCRFSSSVYGGGHHYEWRQRCNDYGGYVARRPGDPADITNSPRVDFEDVSSLLATRVDPGGTVENTIGSRLVTSTFVHIVSPIWSKGSHKVHFSVWCTNKENAWVVLGFPG